MAYKVTGDVLTITLPKQDENGEDLPPGEVVGASYLTFKQKKRIQAVSQKENEDLGYLTNLATMQEATLEAWSASNATGYVRDRHGKRVPYGLDTALHEDTSADDLEYISLVLCHVFFPRIFPIPPLDVESADPNAEETTEPISIPPKRERKTSAAAG